MMVYLIVRCTAQIKHFLPSLAEPFFGHREIAFLRYAMHKNLRIRVGAC